MKIGNQRKSRYQFFKAFDDVDPERPSNKEEKFERKRFQNKEQENAHDDEAEFIYRHPTDPEGFGHEGIYSVLFNVHRILFPLVSASELV